MVQKSNQHQEARDAAEASHPARLLKLPEAAAMLSMGKRTVQERVAARELPVVKIGKSVRFDVRDLEAFIERHKLKAAGWKGGNKP